MNYEVNGKLLEQLTTPDGEPLLSAVSNSGTISAAGGKVLLTGDAVAGIVASIINQEGSIEAGSTADQSGSVALEGRGEGIVLNTGTIDVSGRRFGADAGSVTLAGDLVGHAGTILADGRADADAGSISITSSGMTVVGTGSLTSASGRGRDSRGGDILIASDNATMVRADAALEARGGVTGDGGLIKIGFGNDDVGFDTTLVDTSAPRGTTGTLFIDPPTLTITDGAANPGDLTNPIDFVHTSATNSIAEQTLEGLSSDTDVILQARNRITLADLTDDLLHLQTGSGNTVVLRTRNDTTQGDRSGGASASWT
jgi:hypothetical protein